MNLTESTKNFFLKWNNFSDRSSRSEFLLGNLAAFIILIVFGFVTGFASGMLSMTITPGSDTEYALTLISYLLQIYLCIAGLGLAVRRLHDLNKSGWWILIYFTVVGAFVLIYWYCSKGHVAENKYGPDPLS